MPIRSTSATASGSPATPRPVVTFGGAKPTPGQFAQLHEQTHERCFIANSVKTEILLQPRIA